MEAEVIKLLLFVGVPLLLLLLGYIVGSCFEKKHYKSILAREAANTGFLLTTMKSPVVNAGSRVPMLVTGSAVISSDYFKNWLFGIRNVFGGESESFTRLFDRARREATLRMIDEARRAGYTAICNVRYESADIGGNAASANVNRKQMLTMAACSVSGTAYIA